MHAQLNTFLGFVYTRCHDNLVRGYKQWKLYGQPNFSFGKTQDPNSTEFTNQMRIALSLFLTYTN